jgi:hypothetical protein
MDGCKEEEQNGIAENCKVKEKVKAISVTDLGGP